MRVHTLNSMNAETTGQLLGAVLVVYHVVPRYEYRLDLV